MRTEADQEHRFTRRALLLGGGQAVVGLLIAGRMTQLAVTEGSKYQLLAEENRVALRLVAPRRGWIVDRRGRPLAMNRPDYRLELIPDQVPDLEATLAELARLVPMTPEDFARIRDEVANRPGYLPVAVASSVPWPAFAAVNVRLPELPGVVPMRGFTRLYPGGAAYGHLLGYMAQPSAEEFATTKNRLLLLPGFRVGKDGVERVLEDRLRGTAGARREEVNASGRPVRTLDSVADTPGATIKLTIDRELQDFAARRVGEDAASVVVMDCWTGDVLTMVSLPSFDPNAFSDGISHAEWGAMQDDERHPLVNKAVGGAYPPGSTFKMATALAILGAGIAPEAGIGCRGGYRFGGHYFRCHRGRGHGGVNLRTALPQSCNTYFYHFGHKVGIDAIAAAATQLGLGGTFELPLPSQRAGLVPTAAWKEERYGKAWLPGETLSCAIGQGYVSATPLQLAVMTARLASGRAVVPRLVADGPPPAAPALAFDPEHLALVRTGMDGVVNSGIGTAKRTRLQVEGVRMAAKTGTAQAVGRGARPRGRESAMARRFRNHAWFVGFAPADAPRYALAVLVEHGGAGGATAGPIARDVMTYLFEPATALAALEKIETARARQRAAAEAARLAALEAARLAALEAARPPDAAAAIAAAEPAA